MYRVCDYFQLRFRFLYAIVYTWGEFILGQKLIAKLKANSKSFTFNEAETLLGYFSYYRSNKGKTSGSRIMFVSDVYKTKILLHKPHPRKELLDYQIKQLIEQLEQEGLL